MSERAELDRRAAELRRTFDRSFAAPPAEAAADVEDLLLLRVAGLRHAVRLRELAGVVGRRELVPVPTASPDLLGLAGIRGTIVPVFALSRLLGLGDGGEPAWLLVGGTEPPIGLAFAELLGHLRLPRKALHGDPAGADRRFVREVAATDGGPVPVVAVSLLIATLRNRRVDRRGQES